MLNSSGRNATICGLVAILMWSTASGLIRSVSEHFGPIGGAALLYSVGALLLIALLGRPHLRHTSRFYLLVGSALFVAYEICLSLALGYALSNQQSIQVCVVNSLWACLTVLLAIVMNKQPARWLIAPGTALALFGVFWVVSTDGLSLHSLIANVQSNPPQLQPGRGLRHHLRAVLQRHPPLRRRAKPCGAVLHPYRRRALDQIRLQQRNPACLYPARRPGIVSRRHRHGRRVCAVEYRHLARQPHPAGDRLLLRPRAVLGLCSGVAGGAVGAAVLAGGGDGDGGVVDLLVGDAGTQGAGLTSEAPRNARSWGNTHRFCHRFPGD